MTTSYVFAIVTLSMSLSDYVTELHLYGWQAIRLLQQHFSDYSEWMLFLSKLGDPRYAFLIYFPVVFCLSRPQGTQILWVACVSEWMNAVLKLILHGDRPYWWVGKTFHNKGKEEWELPVQYHLTCETGPGSPSGHCMVTSAVFYAMVTSTLDSTKHQSRAVHVSVWTMFVVLISAVNISRVFIATHFPHQVIVGTIVGIVIGQVVSKDIVAGLRIRHYSLGILVAVGVCLMTYNTLLVLSYDPLWSIPMAYKWCANTDWVHPDTTLFFSVVRDIACLTGFGFCVWIIGGIKSIEGSTLSSKTLQIITSLCVTFLMETFKLPRDSDTMFYGAAFAKFFSMMLVQVIVIPAIFDRCFTPVCVKEKSS